VRAITKGPEPASLTRHRLSPHCDYDNYAGKDDLRHALVTEQRGLCCYCMGRIHNGSTTMKIEHWRCEAHHPAEQLNYQNLLGACLGGHGQPGHLQHCDTKKGDRDLRWNPADPADHIETRVRYELDGTIRADDAVFDDHLNDVLNLNLAHIKNNRRGVLTALLEWWRAKRSVPRARIEREIDERTNAVGDLRPYCQVALWWLREKVARMP
jgi:uncharacterized protein (TIGR02646 family)